jgi:hypothetical protein
MGIRRKVPLQVQVGGPSRNVHEVAGTVTDDLIRDVHIAGLRIEGFVALGLVETPILWQSVWLYGQVGLLCAGVASGAAASFRLAPFPLTMTA